MKRTFTFQYVSIISNHRRRKNVFTIIIYIPICFYYFIECAKGEILNANLHSNMFLLFPFLSRRILRRKNIYIPICFYYFWSSPSSVCLVAVIYIPICFYYFKTRLFAFLSNNQIYIPICFYYFIKTR